MAAWMRLRAVASPALLLFARELDVVQGCWRVPMSSAWSRMVPGSKGGSFAGSTFAADRCVFCHGMACFHGVCVVSVIVNNILSARVVLSLCRLCWPAVCRK
jgi:hypothetical protein